MSKVPVLQTLEETREFFKNDRFATENGMVIESVEARHAVIRLDLAQLHRNAAGGVMGGVTFTMSDFACAVGANFGGNGTYVSIDSNISFISGCRGKTLFAESVCLRSGKTLDFYEVTVRDELGNLVSKASFTMYKVS